MTVIEPLFHNRKALHNMDKVNMLCHNDNHQIIILVKVVNDAAHC